MVNNKYSSDGIVSRGGFLLEFNGRKVKSSSFSRKQRTCAGGPVSQSLVIFYSFVTFNRLFFLLYGLCSVFQCLMQQYTNRLPEHNVFTTCRLLVHSIYVYSISPFIDALLNCSDLCSFFFYSFWQMQKFSVGRFFKMQSSKIISSSPLSSPLPPSPESVTPPRLQPSRPNLSFLCECLVQLAQQKLE